MLGLEEKYFINTASSSSALMNSKKYVVSKRNLDPPVPAPVCNNQLKLEFHNHD